MQAGGKNPLLVSIPAKFDLVTAWLNLLLRHNSAEFLLIKIREGFGDI